MRRKEEGKEGKDGRKDASHEGKQRTKELCKNMGGKEMNKMKREWEKTEKEKEKT